jgi:hypothetical protein
MSKKKTKFYTCLQAACDSDVPGHLLVIAISHQMPDPIADLTSYVVDLNLNVIPPKYKIFINGGKELFPVYPSCFSCIGRDSANTVFVGEDDGFIRYWNGQAEVVKHGPKIGITNCCYFRGVDDVVFGTSGGNVVHSKGQQIAVIAIASEAKQKAKECSVSAIHGIGPNFMVAVGESGLVSRYRNGTWERIKPPSNARLTTVWCRSEKEIYVAGWSGHSWRWDGDDRWQKLKVDFKFEMRDFDFANITEYQSVVYAACYSNGVYRLDGNTWTPIPKTQDEDVSFLTTTSSGLIGLGALWGDSGSWFTRFDGTTWTTQQIHVDPV